WARFHAQVLMDESDYTPQHGITIRGMLLDVAERYGHFVTQDWRSSTDPRTALDFTDWAHEMERKTRGALEGRTANRRYMGDCPHGDCVGDLYLKSGRESMRCDRCGVETMLEDQRAYVVACFLKRQMTRSELVSALFLVDITVTIEA